MNKFVQLFLGLGVLALCLLLSSCEKDNGYSHVTLSVYPAAIALTQEGTLVEVQVSTSASTYTHQTDEDWLIIDQVGKTLSVSAQANTTGRLRNGEIKITAGTSDSKQSITIVVQQAF